jgi:hypothetical protein
MTHVSAYVFLQDLLLSLCAFLMLNIMFDARIEFSCFGHVSLQASRLLLPFSVVSNFEDGTRHVSNLASQSLQRTLDLFYRMAL